MLQFRILKFRLFLLVPCFCLVSGIFVSCKGSEPTTDNSSAYISEVFEYVYAPGQHAKIAKPTDIANFIGKPTDKWLYLGGFGGYVIAGFDHDVINGAGADFEVYALKGASPEPGIVYVMSDDNGDGKPNETWYELKGNQDSVAQHNYWVRYYNKAKTDSSNITWLDSKGNRGELVPGFGSTYSAGWWWPATTTDSITFKGTRLPDSYDDDSSNGTQYWVVPKNRFTWGYVKNLYGTDYDAVGGGNLLDISNAIDSLGNPVTLKSIRFIKVQTAVFQRAGWLNEVSTEIRGAKDLRK
jgi:hypothetical protein